MLKMKAYEFILKVTTFQLPTVYRFSTADGKTLLWMDSATPGLIRVKSDAGYIHLRDHIMNL